MTRRSGIAEAEGAKDAVAAIPDRLVCGRGQFAFRWPQRPHVTKVGDRLPTRTPVSASELRQRRRIGVQFFALFI